MLGMAISGGFPDQAASVWSAVSGGVADFLDNTPWESAWPLLLIGALLFLAVLSLAFSSASGDEEDAESWRRMALAGRCLFSGGAVLVAIGWMAGRATGMI